MYARKLVNAVKDEDTNEIEFSLDEEHLKPVFMSLENQTRKGFTCMLDSGASIPVWCSGAKLLRRTFPEAMHETDMKSLLSGFGSGLEIADVYYLPKMELYDGSCSIVFQKVYLPVVKRDNFGANLILPSSIFKNANILISQMQPLQGKKLFFQCRHLVYKLKYTVCSLSLEILQALKEKYSVEGISEKHRIVGAEREFRQELMQLSELVEQIENFAGDVRRSAGGVMIDTYTEEDTKVQNDEDIKEEVARRVAETMEELKEKSVRQVLDEKIKTLQERADRMAKECTRKQDK